MMTLEQAEKRSIIKILAGSHIHGLAIETSDKDEEAIVIEPIEEAMGLGSPFEELIREDVLFPECRVNYSSKLVCSKGIDGCIEDHVTPRDVKYVSLRKWCRLALKGNPNFLLALFAPRESIIGGHSLGEDLRDLKESFISKQSIKSHLGYIQGQRHRMLSGSHGGRGKPRQDKIDEFGFDVKYGMHLIRLALQGLEVAQTGKITLPVPEPHRSYLRRVRAGEILLEEVLSVAADLEAQMKAAFDSGDCKLPDEPDYATVEAWMLQTYAEWWKCDKNHKDQLRSMEIHEKFRRAKEMRLDGPLDQ